VNTEDKSWTTSGSASISWGRNIFSSNANPLRTDFDINGPFDARLRQGPKAHSASAHQRLRSAFASPTMRPMTTSAPLAKKKIEINATRSFCSTAIRPPPIYGAMSSRTSKVPADASCPI